MLHVVDRVTDEFISAQLTSVSIYQRVSLCEARNKAILSAQELIRMKSPIKFEVSVLGLTFLTIAESGPGEDVAERRLQ